MVHPVPIESYPQKTLLGVPPVVLVLSCLCLAMRLWVRRQKRQNFFVHDYLSVAGFILSFGMYLNTVLAVTYGGLGLNVEKLQLDNVNFVFHGLVAMSIIYGSAVAMIQLSILALYVQVFGVVEWHKNTCYGLMTLIVGWWTVYFIVTLTSCIPLDKFWTPGVPGKCINEKPFAQASGLAHTILDFLILTSSLPIVWRLQTSLQNKITCSIACTLGLFATACGFLKMNYLINLVRYDPEDFTESAWLNILFMHLECNTAIICSCMPTVLICFNRLSKGRFGIGLRSFVSGISTSARRLISSRSNTSSIHSELSVVDGNDKKYHSQSWLPTKPKDASNGGAFGSQTYFASVGPRMGPASESNSASSVPLAKDSGNVKITTSWNVADNV